MDYFEANPCALYFIIFLTLEAVTAAEFGTR